MYVMRPANYADEKGITQVIVDRCTHLADRRRIRHARDAVHSLLTRHPTASDQLWVFTDETAAPHPGSRSHDAPIVGCLTLTARLPHTPLWTPTEHAEACLSLEHLYTHPAPEHRRVGWMMTCCALDHVARTFPRAHWVRCAVPHTRLLHHLREQWGGSTSAADPVKTAPMYICSSTGPKQSLAFPQ
ncbi:hypothetical protein [Streptomyces sp. NBC_00648]|uniref:hypothetical protein n=1 Tax=Streptomyces sp. NBC_00648 TaxID=2975797 RepID=UPI00324844C7